MYVFVCVCMCVCIYIYIFMCKIGIYIYTYVYIYMYVYIYIHIWIWICIYIYIYTHTHRLLGAILLQWVAMRVHQLYMHMHVYICIYTHTDPLGANGWPHIATHCSTLTHLLKALVLSLKTGGNNLCDFASPEEGLVHLLDFAPLLQNLGPGRKLRVCVCVWQDAFICVSYRSDVCDIAMRCHTQYTCVETRQYAHTLFYTQHWLL